MSSTKTTSASLRLWAVGLSTTVWILTAGWIATGLGGLGTQGAKLFNWHPFLASFAVLALLPQGILSWRYTNEKNRLKVKVFHGVVMTTAFVVLNIAVLLAYRSHVQQNRPNFYSLHSWVGLIAIGGMKGNVIGGLLATFVPYYKKLKFTTALHRYSGLSAGAMGFIAMLLGFAELQGSLVNTSQNVFAPLTVVGGILGVLSLLVGGLMVRCLTEANQREEMEMPTAGCEDKLRKEDYVQSEV